MEGWALLVLLIALALAWRRHRRTGSPMTTRSLNGRLKAVVEKGSVPMPDLNPVSFTLTFNALIVTDPRDAETVDGAPQGNPTNPDIVWQSSDLAILAVTPSPDKKQCFVESLAVGVANISWSADGLTESVQIMVLSIEPPPPGPTKAFNASVQVVPKA